MHWRLLMDYKKDYRYGEDIRKFAEKTVVHKISKNKLHIYCNKAKLYKYPYGKHYIWRGARSRATGSGSGDWRSLEGGIECFHLLFPHLPPWLVTVHLFFAFFLFILFDFQLIEWLLRLTFPRHRPRGYWKWITETSRKGQDFKK